MGTIVALGSGARTIDIALGHLTVAGGQTPLRFRLPHLFNGLASVGLGGAAAALAFIVAGDAVEEKTLAEYSELDDGTPADDTGMPPS